ncbi:hypothetical protein [Phenylobacterium sp. J367]|uniref:NAD-dependent epimerase/dehydratase family protein n=1 Tax=Phenylobacterium sp. J367 TaxID=2898435 RepID=UPI0027E221BC|nr:hypothetical protein [Phenylobacterium sp. J367]
MGERLTVVRPPAIYGPGDRELLPLFQLAATSPVLPVLGESARTAVIHVEDAAAQVAELAGRPPSGATYALTDARPDGYGWREIMQAAAEVMDARPRLTRAPAAAVKALALLSVGQRWAGAAPIFTPGKARELLHTDWSVKSDEIAPGLPVQKFDLWNGLAHTADWYRAVGWLPKIL